VVHGTWDDEDGVFAESASRSPTAEAFESGMTDVTLATRHVGGPLVVIDDREIGCGSCGSSGRSTIAHR
jgi:hypothetical protein